MKLNEIRDNPGARKRRMIVGRGIGSGKGKTCGRGVKGQKARTGVALKGFEGGQMPLHRRLPKRGFVSLTRARVAEIRLSDLQAIPVDEIDLAVLKQCGVVSSLALAAKVVLNGELSRKVVLKGIAATKGAKAAIEAAGGSVEAAAE